MVTKFLATVELASYLLLKVVAHSLRIIYFRPAAIALSKSIATLPFVRIASRKAAHAIRSDHAAKTKIQTTVDPQIVQGMPIFEGETSYTRVMP